MTDDWVSAAMDDENLVAELLLRMKQADAVPSMVEKRPVVPLRWGSHQPRSRSMRSDEAVSLKKGGDSGTNTRGSPTTPLSWSGGCAAGSASPSGTADGCEETSRQASGSRSKAAATTKETASNCCTRRSRKKKTYTELLAEESMLLKEGIYLRKEIATLNTTFEKHQAKNKSLKRMKVDIDAQQPPNICSTSGVDAQSELSGQPHQRVVACSLDQIPSDSLLHASVDNHSQSDSSKTDIKAAASAQESFFLLPDLNMLPSEGEPGIETL